MADRRRAGPSPTPRGAEWRRAGHPPNPRGAEPCGMNHGQTRCGTVAPDRVAGDA